MTSAALALALGLGLKEWIARPRVTLILRHRSRPAEVSDRVVTRRMDTGETAAFVRLRVDNRGRSTARRVGVRVLQVHHYDDREDAWIRTTPELDGRLLQPSNQLPDAQSLDTLDVFPSSDGIVDLASVNCDAGSAGFGCISVEIGYPRPRNGANLLEPGTWQLDLLVSGDNITAKRYFVVLSFDGATPGLNSAEIWDHFRIDGPSTHREPLVAAHRASPAQTRVQARGRSTPVHKPNRGGAGSGV
ncbi:MAG TPA: hypothetical protein VFH62_03490 [Dehalococcoidia bacterium]|nr:hypothetical protein [Dehalococcoidia bacterium]